MVLQGSIKTNNTCLLAYVVVGGVGSSPPSPHLQPPLHFEYK